MPYGAAQVDSIAHLVCEATVMGDEPGLGVGAVTCSAGTDEHSLCLWSVSPPTLLS